MTGMDLQWKMADCDDSSPWINPARDEETGDDIDNDCDGLR